jgi:hypothetical protein
MRSSASFHSGLAVHRPPSAPARETRALGEIAWRWRDELERALTDVAAEAVKLDPGQLDELAVLMTELAEDLHTDSGFWRELETAHRALFDTPLPLIWRTGDAALAPFDARRFQFFLHTVWRHFKSDRIMSPRHRGFVAVSSRAEAFFAKAFAGHARASSIAAFLGTANTRGWEVKRKLVWLGTHGYPFRSAYADYLGRNPPKDNDHIGVTDDFLCQECTAWSGFGALEMLAAVLVLPEEDRAILRGWHERHAAFYRVEALRGSGTEIETMSVINLINDRPCSVRLEILRSRCPFTPGQMIFGSLVPWRGEWYWSGAQSTYPQVPPDFPAIRRSMIEKSASIVYRYRADLAEQAKQISARYHAAFVRFHGSDLAVFADGLTAAAAEKRRMREEIETEAGTGLPAFLAKHGLDRTGPKLSWPQKLIRCRKGVAVFYHEGEGMEIFAGFDVLRNALGKTRAALSTDEADVLQAFVEGDRTSPAFVRRVIREHGSGGIAALYCLPVGDESELEYLLRCFKGAYYRHRYPSISLSGAE